MHIDVVTLFPDMVAQAAGFGVTGRARQRGLWHLGLWNPRDFTTDNHKTVDDRPYGGGPGMVMLGEPLSQAIAAAKAAQMAAGVPAPSVIHLSPAGVPLTHEHVLALALAMNAGYVLLAGRYEGIDERLLAQEADEEIAIGDFVVSGGELPALMLIDAIARQLPGALNDEQSAQQDSFVAGLARLPALHAAGSLRRRGRTRCAAVGPSCAIFDAGGSNSRWVEHGNGGRICCCTGR